MKHPSVSFDKSRQKWFIYHYKPNGKRTRTPVEAKTRKQAERHLIQFQPPEPKKGSSVSLTAFHEEFKAYSAKKYSLKTQKHFNVALRVFIASIGDKPVSNVTVKDCQLFLASVECDTSIWSARKYYTALASAFERAKDWGHISSNVWRSVEKPKEGEREIVFFERPTFDKFLLCVSERDKSLYIFAAHTGMRLAEICNAKWKNINWGKNYIRVVSGPTFRTKNKRGRNIPMSNTLQALLKEVPMEGEYIFGYKENTVSQNFRDYIDDNLWLDQRLHFHCLRHTFASWLVQSHVPLAEVQKLLGHASIKTTEIYAHLVDDTLQESIRVLDK